MKNANISSQCFEVCSGNLDFARMSLQVLQSVEDIWVKKGKKTELPSLFQAFCRLWGAQGRECEMLFFRQRRPLNIKTERKVLVP